jgi:hypothetical protein
VTGYTYFISFCVSFNDNIKNTVTNEIYVITLNLGPAQHISNE